MSFIDEGIYFEASNLANGLAKEVARAYNIPIYCVNCRYIRKYVEEFEGISFLEVSFGKHLDQMLLGAISKVFGEIIISINKTVMYERKLFTSMHEVGHFYFDLEDLNAGNQLTDMINENGYLPEDFAREYRANVTASVLMANDEALKYAIRKFKTIKEVANYFFMSKSALRIRLREYLIYHLGCSPNYAFRLVNDYVYSNGQLFKTVFYK